LDHALLRHTFFACYENEKIDKWISNRVMGCIPRHPLLGFIMHHMQQEYYSSLEEHSDSLVKRRFSSGFLTLMIKKYEIYHKKPVILPSHTFFPVHYNGEYYQGRGKVYAIQYWRSMLKHDEFVGMLEVNKWATHFFRSKQSYDLSVAGSVIYADGIGRQVIGVLDLLKKDLKINFYSTRHIIDIADIHADIQQILFDLDKAPGNILLFYDIPWAKQNPFFKPVLDIHSKIKIAYSMTESSRIPEQWVFVLNRYFDAVAVPDPFLIEVYQQSGVQIPIFELPLGVDIEDFLHQPRPQRPRHPFVFGSTASCEPRKNLLLLIQAFAEEFGNDPSVVLKINSRRGMTGTVQKFIQSLGISNIRFTHRRLNKQSYLEFMSSFDCYVNIAKGEGFSIGPREALALEIPCILSDNTAQTSICKTGLVRAVPSLIEEPAFYKIFGNRPIGTYFNCQLEDVKMALRDVYNHYPLYQDKAKKGPEWVKSFRWNSLKSRYLNLIKPTTVLLGDVNEVTETYLMTNSVVLFRRYVRYI
jgi:glycosyltransferase involved in cell wall biosynthesis